MLPDVQKWPGSQSPAGEVRPGVSQNMPGKQRWHCDSAVSPLALPNVPRGHREGSVDASGQKAP